MSREAIVVSNLRKRFGRKEVLKGIDLAVPTGAIFGLLGRNGEGKTTTIRAMLGLLPFDGGECRVLGMDSAREGVRIRGRVGYMAENQTMYDWMSLRQIIDWVAAFYPSWDRQLVRDLQQRFALEDGQKVGALSKGQMSKLALLLALGHRPELMVLDDPTLGLDPVARKDFLREVIGQLQDRGITVLFSSHLLYEIEPICDHVAILDGGRVIKAAATEDLHEQVKRLVVAMPEDGEPAGELQAGRPHHNEGAVRVPGLLDAELSGREAALVTEEVEAARAALAGICGGAVEVEDLNLDEIFEAYVIGRRAGGPFVREESTPGQSAADAVSQGVER